MSENIFFIFGKQKDGIFQRCMALNKKHVFFGKWTLNLGKVSDRKRHIPDSSSKS